MGGAASKEVAKKAAVKATTTTTMTAKSAATPAAAARRVIRTNLSREAIVVSHSDTSTRDLNGASLVRNPNAPPQKPVELQEMNLALLDDIKRFEDYEKVGFLEVRGGRRVCFCYCQPIVIVFVELTVVIVCVLHPL